MHGLICEVGDPRINSFNTYSLSTFYMLGIAFSIWDAGVNKMVPHSHSSLEDRQFKNNRKKKNIKYDKRYAEI